MRDVVKIALLFLAAAALGLLLASPWHPNRCGTSSQAASLGGEPMTEYQPEGSERTYIHCTEQDSSGGGERPATVLRSYSLASGADPVTSLRTAMRAAEREHWTQTEAIVTPSQRLHSAVFTKDLGDGKGTLTLTLPFAGAPPLGNERRPALRVGLVHEFKP